MLDENGLQSNHVVELDYQHIWQSERTSNSYPAQLIVRIPTANIELTLTALLDNPEFCHGNGGTVNINGCQSPCMVKGHYGEQTIDRMVILEMIGDVCGQIK